MDSDQAPGASLRAVAARFTTCRVPLFRILPPLTRLSGPASRETDAFVREFLRKESLDAIFSVTVNESGASIYSASEVARQEFPDLDLTVRGAISIARRL